MTLRRAWERRGKDPAPCVPFTTAVMEVRGRAGTEPTFNLALRPVLFL